MVKNSVLIFLVFLMVSCKLSIDPHSPAPHFDQSLKNASPDFQKGWRDGCESGMKAGNNSFYQMFYKGNQQDGFKMATSPEYSDAWDKAWWYCMHSNYIDKKSGIYGSMFSGYQ